MDYDFNFAAVWRDFDLLLSGLGLGLFLAVVSIAIGCLIGLLAAFGMLSRHSPVRWVSTAYVSAIRNTPILVLILFTYFALPQFGLRLGKIESFIVTLAIYSGAYLTEVFRSGLVALPTGLREAGLTIGLTEFRTKILITIPVMFRNVLPALGNNFISLFKDTSLAAAIAVPELTFYARKINVETFRVIETWLVASLMYVLACSIIAALLRQVEARLAIPR
ncbi:amino acid ABC transporter permease [Aliiruegeria lutimaris]|uniref:Amino acid ABC transporter membrane protein 1, PAAT family n=1 Tax=Aliiruegeria lutimaris TaxID=571298 RepID=A0A1G9HFQ7_9RHOB|nr:amino acid ABC transporter permease [Aliiruegeria lutimaris]SDL11735.1 amino acid ABC transporter membrane protein 1, PAAT family [Aliiruegeria lutimaris]